MMLFPLFIFAQIPDPVKFEIKEIPETVQAGDIFNIVIDATIEGNWHLYSILNNPDAGPFLPSFQRNHLILL